MSLTERQKAIVLECFDKLQISIRPKDAIAATELFLSRIREKQEAAATIVVYNDVVSVSASAGMISRLKDMHGAALFTIPPAAPYCPRRLDNGGMSSTAVICGNQSSADVLISKIQKSAPACDCKELVEALEKIRSHDTRDGIDAALMRNIASEALANHAKRMKGEE